jgi:hypothetical protein
MTTQQVETAVVSGTITGDGNAAVTVTAYGMTNSPKTLNVAVLSGDTASIVGAAIRSALAFDSNVAAMFLVSGAGANVVLTKHVASANDATLNIAITNGTCTGLTPALTSTNTTAGSGIENGYCTLAQLKSSDVLNISDANSDTTLETVIEAVSRLIDNSCARYFYSSAGQVRYYNTNDPYCLRTDDIASASGVTVEIDLNGDGVYEYTLAGTDYSVAGYNDLLKEFPFSKLETTPAASYTFSTSPKGNKVTATYGWAAVPKPITLACILQSAREYKRFNAILGVSGATAIGTTTLTMPSLDPDVEKLIYQYKRLT